MRTHLEALIRAHIELGADAESAARSAVRQFGKPRKIARSLMREWLRAAPQETAQSRTSATLTALGVLTAVLLITSLLDMHPPIQSPWCIALLTLMGAYMAGMTTAALVRAHAVAATHNAVWIVGLGFFAVLTKLDGLKTSLPVALAALLCGLTLGCLGAYTEKRCQWLRRKIRRRTAARA